MPDLARKVGGEPHHERIKEASGWTRAAAGFAQDPHRGFTRVGWIFTLGATTYNFVRLSKLVRAAASPDAVRTRQKPSK